MENLVMSADFWKGKRVFLTGHTGFKGSWMALWLKKLGATVTGFALSPDTQPSLFSEIEKELGIKSVIGDICDFELLNKTMRESNPEIIFHMAAQPLVRYSYDYPLETFQTNIMGTANLLEAARHLKDLKSIVVITTDKVYENAEWAWSYRENDVLGGHDPYSSSKACAEIVTTAMRKSFFSKPGSPGLATVRAGNVIGGGDWALDRIVPDVMGAFQKSQIVKLRNPKAIRPWQHVLEPLGGYLALGQKLFSEPPQKRASVYSSAWNFGPYADNAVTVGELVTLLSAHWPGGKWEVDQGQHPHEAFYLKLDSSKAKHHLGWHSLLNIQRTAQMTVDWYRHFFNKESSAFDLCNKQIEEYSKELNHVAK
ncbi:MAG TPA: CDP-glucose 4,6-dehydratase [Pseudobdellovibrionaceae bacterium]|jgi:CDP-glucose 4,6-dehydratase